MTLIHTNAGKLNGLSEFNAVFSSCFMKINLFHVNDQTLERDWISSVWNIVKPTTYQYLKINVRVSRNLLVFLTRTEERFLKYESIWLGAEASFPKGPANAARSERSKSESFSDLGDRAKRKRVEGLNSSLSGAELTYASSMKLRFEGQLSAAKHLKGIVDTFNQNSESYYFSLDLKMLPTFYEFIIDCGTFLSQEMKII